MLREALASGTAKLVAACVCPVVGASALTLTVPKVRSAVHDLTAPAERAARAKPRVRQPLRAVEKPKAGPEIICPQPVVAGLSGVLPQSFGDLPEIALGHARPGRGGNSGVGASRNLSPRPVAFLPMPSGGGGGGGGVFPPSDGGREPAPGEPPPNEEDPGATLPNPDPPTLIPIPEPATWLHLLLGFGLLGFALRLLRRRRRSAVQATVSPMTLPPSE